MISNNQKKDFPIFDQNDLAYLDNASTTQKPNVVIDALSNFYKNDNANIHRGIYDLSERATERYEQARQTVGKFVNAKPEEIIFTKNTTEAINLVAKTWGEASIESGDEITISVAEHHSNILPWTELAKKTKAKIIVLPITDEATVDLEQAKKYITSKTKLVAINHISNVLGSINPIKELISIAHQAGAKVLVDGAQAVSKLPVDVLDLDADFYTFSGHKLYGPTGIGVLYAKKELMANLSPMLPGGGTILNTSFTQTDWINSPHRFEGGTPPIAQAIGLKAAIDYVTKLGLKNIKKHENRITEYALEQMKNIQGLTIYGSQDAKNRVGVISFNIEGIHPHDLASILNEQNVAIRAGHHCCQPLMDYFKVPAMSRMSLGIYNTKKDIDRFISGLKKAQEIFK